MKKHKFLAAAIILCMAVNAASFTVSSAPSATPVSSPTAAIKNNKASATPHTSVKPSASAAPKSSSEPKTSQAPKLSSEPKASQTSKPSPTPSPAPDSPPIINAGAAIVIDANSGDTVYSAEPDKKMYTAGLSNIMTAIIALENAKLADECTVTDDTIADVTYKQPQLGMKVGEVYTIEQLLYAILLNSDNDAANLIAETVGGSRDAFVQKMNEKAAELGMKNTHFANPSGLQNEEHYSTAHDLALLARYAMKNATFSQIVSSQTYVFPPTSMRSSQKKILSTNHLVSRYKYPYHYYKYAKGVKSANSEDAGYCLIASAQKGEMSLISVVLDCPNADVNEKAYSFKDTTALLEYVFTNYQSVLLAKKGDVIYDSKVAESKNSTRLALTVSEDIYVILKNSDDSSKITNDVQLSKKIKAPIHQGDTFGTVTYKYGEKTLKTVDLVAANDVQRDFILHIINCVVGFIFNPILLIIIIALAAILIRIRINQNRKRRIRHSRMASFNVGRNRSSSYARRRTEPRGRYPSGRTRSGAGRRTGSRSGRYDRERRR
ncbi:MAG: D-alanyl-D-alanine carboxypeptidase [Firmicutes bacterium]|nr:D-alanyl-D-alanine carboxypeptidase [Bacillota bacterium]